MTDKVEALAKIAVNCGFHLHKELGLGLLESVYSLAFCALLREHGLQVDREKSIPIMFRGKQLGEGFRADILVENLLLIELKSTETHAPVHAKQVLTYIRLLDLPLGLLMNFGAPEFRQGVKRIANNYFRALG